MDMNMSKKISILENRTRHLIWISVFIIILLVIETIGIINIRKYEVPQFLTILDRDGEEVITFRAYSSVPGLYIKEGIDGRLITEIGTPKPEPNLRFFSPSGIETIEISSGQFGEKLSLNNPENKMGAVLALQKEGPSLWFWMEESKNSSLLSLDENGK